MFIELTNMYDEKYLLNINNILKVCKATARQQGKGCAIVVLDGIAGESLSVYEVKESYEFVLGCLQDADGVVPCRLRVKVDS